jgi:thiol-disulfide isomerase/thioredoxin
MKTIIVRKIACLLVAGAFSLTALGNPGPYTLRGTLRGVPDGARVVLVPGATHQEEKPEAEAVVRKGKFEIKGQLAGPRLYYLQVRDGDRVLYHTVMLEPGKMTLDGEVATGGERWRWEKVAMAGSASDRLLKEKTRFREELNKLHVAYNEKHAAVSRQMGAARGAKNQALIDSLEKTPEWQALAADEHAFFRRAGEEIAAAITADRESFWGPLLMLTNYSYFSGSDAEVKLYEVFPDEVKNSHYGQLLHRQLFPERLVGKPLPPFTLADREGTSRDDATLREGKRLVLVDFWASWCAPCRKEIPRLKEIHAAFASKGLEIISISIDKKEADWLKALDEEQLPWPNLLDTMNLFGEQFNGKAIPALFLVNADGIVIADNLRGEPLQQKIAELLAE